MMLDIPINLYGLFLVEPLQISPSVDGYIVVALTLWRVCFFLFLTYCIQATYIVRLHLINREMEGGQCSYDLHLQIICVFVFVAAGFQELCEIIDFVSLLYWIPSSSDHYESVGSQGEVFNIQATDGPERRGFRAAMWRMAVRLNKGKGAKGWRLKESSCLWKSICFWVIAVPRLLICFFLVRFASGFLVRSPTEKMIVDTVAALFVLEIGGFIFGAFTTTEVKQHLAGMDGIKVVTSQWQRLAAFMFVHFFCPLVCVCCAVGMVYYLRQDCPDEDFLSSLLSFNRWKALLLEGVEHED